MILLLVVMFLFPEKGIQMGSYKLQFPTPAEFFGTANENDSIENLEKDLANIFDSTEIAQLSVIDSALIKHRLDSLHNFRKNFQVSDKSKPALHRFFDAIDNATKKKVRIMHYGDSQIEVDRITSYVRNEFQKKFGGNGVGLFPVVDIAPKMSVNIAYSENWKRYPGFGLKDSTVKHNKYGPLISMSRFSPIPNTTIFTEDSTNYEAWITINKPKGSYSQTKSYSMLRILLSNALVPVSYKIFTDNVIAKEGIIPPNSPFIELKTTFDKTPEEIKITFSGKDSPDVYGISIEGKTGIVMDNIPLRGSSGTVFSKLDKTLMANAYANLSPDLIILQFGGNVMPYIKSEKECLDYGNWFKSQIYFLKKLNPKTAFIVIGPSDMSIKEKTDYITYPFLENVRDALKEAALSTDCVFWDMYEVMGGKNSMPKWVNAEPALAASDYTHFTPEGAKKVAEEFYKKIVEMYVEYKLGDVKM